jgi:hypothetical protein
MNSLPTHAFAEEHCYSWDLLRNTGHVAETPTAVYVRPLPDGPVKQSWKWLLPVLASISRAQGRLK